MVVTSRATTHEPRGQKLRFLDKRSTAWSNLDLSASQRPNAKSSSIPPVRRCVLLWHCNHGGYIAVPHLYIPAKIRICDSKFLNEE